jgi:septal ring factor EnvC (AmiA/AmiB activator)
LVLSQVEDKNDFIKCSIVIKNFAAYFRSVGTQLKKNVSEIVELNRDKKFTQRKLNEASDAHEEALAAIENLVKKLNDARLENPIQDNVVEHLARKSESLGELDAELEAENVIGVLRNTKVVTELELVYPVSGKIVTEFGDKDANNEMAHYIAFETYPDAVVTSPAKGLVVFAGRFLNYGNMLIISNGDYRVFLYGMDILFAFIGDLIEIGDYVGHMQSDPGTSPLVKMELRKFGEPLDPRHWMLETIEKREKTK